MLSYIPSLNKLDDKDVTDTERQEAMEWRIQYEQSKSQHSSQSQLYQPTPVSNNGKGNYMNNKNQIYSQPNSVNNNAINIGPNQNSDQPLQMHSQPQSAAMHQNNINANNNVNSLPNHYQQQYPNNHYQFQPQFQSQLQPQQHEHQQFIERHSISPQQVQISQLSQGLGTGMRNKQVLPSSTKENILLAVFALLNELDHDGLQVVKKQLDKLLQGSN